MKRLPLWLKSLLLGACMALVLWVLHVLGVGLPLLLLLVVLGAAVASQAPMLGVRLFSRVTAALRAWHWRHESGRHHSFAGTTLQVHEADGQVWLAASSLQQVLGKTEDPLTTASRMPGQWQRNSDGEVLLNVQAVVTHLAHMPGRDDPRVQRFRRYLERDVLFPARQRARREAGV